MSAIRKWAWVYAALFFGVVAIGYIPGFTNDQGQLLGLFVIEPKDDLLHLGSAIWAGVAAWLSARASLFYFRFFGLLYFLDGVVGLFTGQGYLDLGILNNGVTSTSLIDNLPANIPHLIIGGVAVLVGYVWGRNWAKE